MRLRPGGHDHSTGIDGTRAKGAEYTAGCWTAVPDAIEPDRMGKAVARDWPAVAASLALGASSPASSAHGRHIVARIEAAHQVSTERREIALPHVSPS